MFSFVPFFYSTSEYIDLNQWYVFKNVKRRRCDKANIHIAVHGKTRREKVVLCIMKKYRIQRASPWGIYGKFALFFALWNYIGYKLYHKLSDSGRKKNKSFDNLPFSQKILTLYKDPTDEIQFVKMEGMTVKGTRKIAVGELGQKIDVNDKTASSNVVDSEELKD